MVTRQDVAPAPLIYPPPTPDEPAGGRVQPLPPPAELVAIAVSLVLATLYLATPPLGTDLSAQLARAGFAATHPATPVDLSWFGGTVAFGYSVLSPYVMAVLGVRITGGVCCVLASWLLARLFVRTGARRPALGAGIGALLQVTNLVDGRITFALGIVFAVASLVALTSDGRGRLFLAAGAAILCGLSSPVAAYCLLLCATVLVVLRRPREALVVGVAAVLPVALVESAFGQGGREPFNHYDLVVAVVPMVVLAAVTGGRREVRWGALVAVAATVMVAAVSTPLGDNSTRVSLLFVPAVLAAYTSWRGPWLVSALLLACIPQQLGQLHAMGLDSQSAAFYAPIRAEIGSRAPITGRLELPETSGHWDASALETTAPLARGWNRQLDVQWNSLFFEDPLTPASYRQWLLRNRVQYVAVPDVPYTEAGRREVRLVDSGLPYLSDVWSGPGWRLYQVTDPRPIVPAPAYLVSLDSAAVTFTAPSHREVQVGVRMTPWTTLTGTDPDACLSIGADGDAVVHTSYGGDYRLTSTFGPRSRRC